MSRKIKFRVWNHSESKFQKVKMLDWRYPSGLEINGKDALHYTVMQFTGLIDKKGVDIYEGDIINQCGFHCPGIVRFGTYIRKNFSNHDMQVKHHGWYFEPIPYTDKYNFTWNNDVLSLVEDEQRGFEVIGNIYENPDLLEEENE